MIIKLKENQQSKIFIRLLTFQFFEKLQQLFHLGLNLQNNSSQ